MMQVSTGVNSEQRWEGRLVFPLFLCSSLWGIQLMLSAIKKEMVGLLCLTMLSLWFKYFSPVNVLGYSWTVFCPIKGTKLKTALALCFSDSKKCHKISPPFREPVKFTLNVTSSLQWALKTHPFKTQFRWHFLTTPASPANANWVSAP